MDVSICMVSLNCWCVLGDCLESLRDCQPHLDVEVILVDNGSRDQTASFVRRLYPHVNVIENGRNVGFTVATNQAIRASCGKYILWLNTDTVLRPDSIYQMWRFLEDNPQVGIVGPKVLNPDGSFQPQCRRGLPSVAASLCYFVGLDRVFPRSRVCGQYLQTFLPEDEAATVVAVSGCCLMARRTVYEQIGPLDEEIFAFGEDLDWCYRAVRAGWQVWYFPRSVIVHLKGKGGVHSNPYRKVFGMHHGMLVFYRKHFQAGLSRMLAPIVWTGIGTSFILSLGRVFSRQCCRKLRGFLG